mmetsp:Transcript_9541/g.14100  ORF Transcript_9541/g.14100 Transcript_9541/m.14100 type:complete len:110 (-) Transcript_9541:618-947(-)
MTTTPLIKRGEQQKFLQETLFHACPWAPIVYNNPDLAVPSKDTEIYRQARLHWQTKDSHKERVEEQKDALRHHPDQRPTPRKKKKTTKTYTFRSQFNTNTKKKRRRSSF